MGLGGVHGFVGYDGGEFADRAGAVGLFEIQRAQMLMQLGVIGVNEIQALQRRGGFLLFSGVFELFGELFEDFGTAAAGFHVALEFGGGGGFVAFGFVGLGQHFVDVVLFDVVGIPV